ncbi:MAG: polyprenyl synthetase family protein [Phycisphaerae bacterium]|nr:polyprenyl synthetase family protein [Phycisphaerae bacterium]
MCPEASNDETARLETLLAAGQRCCREDLARWLVPPGTPEALAEATRYAALNGGKRLRPALVLLSARAAGGSDTDEPARRAAVAVELVHTYSLVHDDLPAMDDDDLRRGRASAHVQFGEAMGVLVGDALLTRAFEVLAELGGALSASLAAELARGAGPAGMIAGQVADMGLCALPAGEAAADYIHARKTAALLRAAARMGGRSAGASDDVLEALGAFGEAMGLAFQLIDDILDVTGSAAQLGKTPGKDADTDKRTSVSELGLDGARRRADALTRRAVAAVAPLGAPAGPLADLAAALGRRER